MYWIASGFLSNIAFAMQDTLIYQLTAVKSMNSMAVGATMHMWFSVIATAVLAIVYAANAKVVKPILKDIRTLLTGYSIHTCIYALLLFVANGLLYEAYSLGGQLDNINPGIASTLSNMSLIVSAGLPALFLGKKLSMLNSVGILIYLVAAYMLVSAPTKKPSHPQHVSKLVEPDTSGATRQKWITYCLGSALLYGLATFLAFITISESKLRTSTALTYVLFVAETMIGILLYLLVSQLPNLGTDGLLKNYMQDFAALSASVEGLDRVLPASVLGGCGIYALYDSYRTAPNPGFSDAISNLYTATQALIAWYLYGTALDETQMMGVGLAALSITFLSV